MIAIAQKIVLAPRPPARRVEGKAFDQVMGEAVGDTAFSGDQRKAVKGRVAGAFPTERPVGLGADMGEPGLRVADLRHVAAMVLSIGQIVAFAAPGIEEPCPLPGFRGKEHGRHRKAF